MTLAQVLSELDRDCKQFRVLSWNAHNLGIVAYPMLDYPQFRVLG